MRSERSVRTAFVCGFISQRQQIKVFEGLKVIISSPIMVADHNVSVEGPFLP